MATRGRKLRKIWRILEKENSFAGTVQTLLHGTVAQVRRRRYCLQVKEQRHRKETMPWGQMLDLGGPRKVASASAAASTLSEPLGGPRRAGIGPGP